MSLLLHLLLLLVPKDRLFPVETAPPPVYVEVRPPQPLERELDLPIREELEQPREKPAERLAEKDQVVEQETAPEGQDTEDLERVVRAPEPAPKMPQPSPPQPEPRPEKPQVEDVEEPRPETVEGWQRPKAEPSPELPDLETLLPDPDELDERVTEQLAHTAMFAGLFRENAARALLLPRRRPDQRTPLWAQRLKSQNLLAAVRQYPSFPIVLETYRQALSDIFDIQALRGLLRDIQSRKLRVDEVETRSASPFARSLVFAYVAAYIYEQDSPLAERKAQALTLDPESTTALWLSGMAAEEAGELEQALAYWQKAEPLLAATPTRSSSSRMPSPSMYSKLMLVVFGSR
mgnify:CR=1 FL=1